MENWLWADASATMWPFALLLCASLLPRQEMIWRWFDVCDHHNVEDADLAFHVAMITATHV